MKQVVMPFDGKVIETVTGPDGKPWISVRSVCEAIGVEVYRQHQRLQNHPTFKVSTYVVPSAGGEQNTLCISLDQLNLWLGSINPMRTQEPVRSNLIAY